MPMDTFTAYKLPINHVKDQVNIVETSSCFWARRHHAKVYGCNTTNETGDKAEDEMRRRIIRDFYETKNACSHCGQNNYWCICDQSVLTPL